MPLQTRGMLLLLDKKGYVRLMTRKRPIQNMQLGLIIIQAVTCVARRAVNPITFMDRFNRVTPILLLLLRLSFLIRVSPPLLSPPQ